MDADEMETMPGSPATGMRAVVQEEYGEAAEVLSMATVDLPEIGQDEVLVEVAAAGVDQGVWHLTAGLPMAVRLAGYGVRRPKNRVPGSDVAGTVVAVGDGVSGLRPGDAVYGIARGSFARYAVAEAAKLAPKPDNLTFEQAAATPVSALAALQAVRDQGQVEAGQRVLVLGASGGVGSFAVQIAKAFRAEVTGVASSAKLDLVRELGADHVVDYTKDDIGPGGDGYDLILDIGGNRSLRDLRRLLAPRGRLVIVGGEAGGRWLGGTDRQIRAMLWSPFVGQKLGTFISSENNVDLAAITELIEAGRVTPAVERTFPLSEAVAAIDHLRGGGARGKVVLEVGGGSRD